MPIISQIWKLRRVHFVGVAVFVALIASFNASNPRNVQAVGPPGCSTDQPYNCAMSRRKFDQVVSSWCGLAKSDKQQECSLQFYTYVHTSPQAVRSNANFSIPSYCRLGYDASETEKTNIPDFCYVIAKQPGAFYNATKEIVEECGVDGQQDQSCVSDIKQQFLHDQNDEWADEPNTAASSSSSGAINTNDDDSRSAFIDRVSTYIRWITVGIGVMAVFGLVISGIQYAAAQENPQSVAAAKSRINNIIIGILIYLTMFALLQWLIPGGVFGA